MADIFLSYKKEERPIAQEVVFALEAAGYSVWWDNDLSPRSSWDTEIEREIAAAKAVLVLWSQKAAMEHSFVRIEAGYAKDHNKLVPVWVERCDLPLRFRDLQTADLSSWDRRDSAHPEWRRALSWLSVLTGSTTAAAPSPKQRDDRSRPGAIWRDVIPGLPPDTCPEMVTIPAGTFLMGGDAEAELPQHEVCIEHAFALSRCPVTFAEWDAAISAGARLHRPEDQGWGRNGHPVINVSWLDAKAYFMWLNGELGLSGRADEYRLPSESEWEYACRAGASTPFSFGKEVSLSQARFSSTWGDAKSTLPVGTFAANAFGLHDMHGNVWEWCEDTWSENYIGAPTNGWPRTDHHASFRVMRGGGWSSYANQTTSSYRTHNSRDERFISIGFRAARLLPLI